MFLCSSREGVTDRWFENEFEGLVIFLHCAHFSGAMFWDFGSCTPSLCRAWVSCLGFATDCSRALWAFRPLFFCGVRVPVFECVVGELAKFAVVCCATSDFCFLTGCLQVYR